METCIETRVQTIWLADDGILRAKSKPNAVVTVADAQEVVQKIGVLCQGKRRPILVDLTGTVAIERAARSYFAGPETAQYECAAALLVGSPLAKAIGNFFIGFNKSIIPARLFTDEGLALAWLKDFLP